MNYPECLPVFGAGQEGNNADTGQGDQAHDQGGQQGNGYELGSLSAEIGHMDLPRQNMHQFINQQAGEQRGQQMQLDHKNERNTHDDPCGDIAFGYSGLCTTIFHLGVISFLK